MVSVSTKGEKNRGQDHKKRLGEKQYQTARWFVLSTVKNVGKQKGGPDENHGYKRPGDFKWPMLGVGSIIVVAPSGGGQLEIGDQKNQGKGTKENFVSKKVVLLGECCTYQKVKQGGKVRRHRQSHLATLPSRIKSC